MCKYFNNTFIEIIWRLQNNQCRWESVSVWCYVHSVYPTQYKPFNKSDFLVQNLRVRYLQLDRKLFVIIGYLIWYIFINFISDEFEFAKYLMFANDLKLFLKVLSLSNSNNFKMFYKILRNRNKCLTISYSRINRIALNYSLCGCHQILTKR